VNEAGTQRRMRLLVVESVKRDRDRLAGIFTGKSGAGAYDVASVATGDAALEWFTTNHPDLILVNIDVAGLGGRKLCSEVRRREGTRHTGIVFLVKGAQAEESLAVECLEMGADDVIDASAKGPILAARIKAVLRLKAMTDELRSANHRLKLLSLTDDLTGLPNMRCFNQKFMGAIRNCRDGKNGLSVVMLDLDHFKSVNDSSNHLVGSHVLATLGKTIRASKLMNEEDVVARYGGDEFVIYMPSSSLDEAVSKAEQIRRDIRATSVTHDGVTVRLTASVGVAWTGAGFDGKAEDLIKVADLMLYRSKEGGRDRVSAMCLTYPLDFESVAPARILMENAGEEEELKHSS
jgi:two-component system cell cycle response regulator